MKIKLHLAGANDIAELVAMRTRVSQDMAKKFGEGFWVGRPADGGERFLMRIGQVYIARYRGRMIATLTLTTRKPWSINVKHFRASARPLYLRAMSVDPAQQRKGVGRKCIAESLRIAAEMGREVIRLDAFDCAAGAGEFYRKCGFAEVARVVYKGVPQIDFELVV
ncbi:MAG: GNAT family N-acetyltransferase [Terracidiphilus sp.]